MAQSHKSDVTRLLGSGARTRSPGHKLDGWWAAAHHVERECRDHPLIRWFAVGDLVFIGATERAGHPLLYRFIHRDTHQHLNIDADGVAWKGTALDGNGPFVQFSSLGAALNDLRLWEVPVIRLAPFEEVWAAYSAAPAEYRSADIEYDDDDDWFEDLDDAWEVDEDHDDEELSS